jgi:hypothetical protein
MQGINQLTLPFDQASPNLGGHLSWEIAQWGSVGEELVCMLAEPSCVVALAVILMLVEHCFEIDGVIAKPE